MLNRTQNEIGGLFAAQKGLVTRAQALAAGHSARQIGRTLTSGEWIAVHAGVYRHAAAPTGHDQALLGAVLAAGPGAAVSHRAAVAVWGLRRYDAVMVEITHRRRTHVALRDRVIQHRARDLRECDIVPHDGLPVTTPARTLLDLGAVMPTLVERAMEEWLADRVVSLDAIHKALREHGVSGRHGVGVLRTAINARALGASIADSGAEALLARVLRNHGVAAPEHHHLVRHGQVIIAELDYAYPAHQIALELDGYGVHLRSRATFEHDRVRQNALEIEGWRFLRFTVDRLTREPARVADEVRRMLARP